MFRITTTIYAGVIDEVSIKSTQEDGGPDEIQSFGSTTIHNAYRSTIVGTVQYLQSLIQQTHSAHFADQIIRDALA